MHRNSSLHLIWLFKTLMTAVYLQVPGCHCRRPIPAGTAANCRTSYVGRQPRQDQLCYIILTSIHHCLLFLLGVYVAQNYQVPNIKKLVDTALIMANIIGEKYQNPKRRGDEDD
ncbi:hypothetical protein AHAS_Ahas04G0160200 [Arachis hypogaea]